jgi:hypothetical protein
VENRHQLERALDLREHTTPDTTLAVRNDSLHELRDEHHCCGRCPA